MSRGSWCRSRGLVHADLVITGEGRLDHQTLCGKMPHAVRLRAAELLRHGGSVIGTRTAKVY
ncbi:glycerate kinase [Mycolicibacterium murale]|nr:glycerate kinase [Mycolicibacterium murale]